MESLEGVLVQIVSGGVTDMGRVRTNNEDSYRIVNPLQLFVLSDGMGGEAHGEIASSLAVESIVKYCSQAKDDSSVTLVAESQDNWSDKTKQLQNAVRAANLTIFESAQQHAEQRGMGNGNRGMAERGQAEYCARRRLSRLPAAQRQPAAAHQRSFSGSRAGATRDHQPAAGGRE